MVDFQYRAIDRQGAQTSGTISARDRSDALQRLSTAGLQTLTLGQVEERAKPSKAKTESKTGPREVASGSRLANLNKIRLTGSQLIIFTEEISDLLNAGIQLEPSLKLMEGRQDLLAIGKIASQLRSEIRDGSSFSKALGKVSPSFDPLYLNLVAAGEASGSLPVLMARHTQYLITIQELKNKTLTAMIYPAFLLLAGASVTVMFISFLIPRLTVLIESTGSSLPKGVQLISLATSIFKTYWWAILGGLLIGGIIFRVIISHPANRPTWDRIKLKIPFIGNLLRARFQVHFLRTLGNLLENGLSLVDSLKLCFGITSNQYLRSEMQLIANEVIDGSPLNASMRKHASFPASLADYIRINEQTGSLDSGIQRAAERSERNLEKTIERVSALIQPIIIVAMAGVIGTMAYTMISVIYDTIEILRSR